MREVQTIAGDTAETGEEGRARRRPAATRPMLVVAWCRDEPWRAGEVLGDPTAPLGRTGVFGRDEGASGRLGSVRQRPGVNEPGRPWTSTRLSREHLVLTPGSAAVDVENLGRRELLVRGAPVARARLLPGDVVEVRNQLVLLVASRPPRLPTLPGAPPHAFGEADAHGIVGESPAAWELRRRLRFLARRDGHVLVRGPSGAGKELAAMALHGRGPLVARNAATLPEGLVDAELFGNVRNYPNPGMPERPGLVGAADGGTLFLDEFAELPLAAQAHLLRVLDAGEYQRLGEARGRTSRFRLVAATNRPPDALKEDVAARFSFVLELPGLDGRREDVPLLARHLLRGLARTDPELAGRFFAGGEPRLAPGLVTALLGAGYTTHVRQVMAMLWRAVAEAPGEELEAPPEPVAEAPAPVPPGLDPWVGRPAREIPPEVLQAALDASNGQVEVAAARLGLSSRFVLSRLIREHGLVRRRRG